MSRTVLLFGAESLLGSYLVADFLLSPREPGDLIHCVGERVPVAGAVEGPEDAIRHALRQLAPREDESLREQLLASRLRWAPRGEGVERVDELWCLSLGGLELLSRVSVAELLLVTEPSTPGDEVERQVAAACTPRATAWRVFRPQLVIGVPAARGPAHQEGLLELLAVLHELKGEVEEREPEYFDHHALRSLAPAGAVLNILPVQHAVRLMRRLAGRTDTLGRAFDIAAPAGVAYAELCEQLGMVYGLSLLAVEREEELNPVDRLFQARLRRFERQLRAPPPPSPEAAYRAAGMEPRDGSPDTWVRSSLLQAVRDHQEAALARVRQRAASVWDSLERKTVDAGGSELTYFAGGVGEPPVVILNALGQGLRYWTRLVDQLISGGRRVLIWEPRGTSSAPRPFLLADQVNDVEAVLRAERVARCHLVGWCTGPTVAVEFSSRRPDAVVSAVSLNASFKGAGSPAELDTDFEEGLEPLCRMLDRRPAMVASVMNSLRSSAAGRADEEPTPSNVLARMNQDLRLEVLAPFRTEASTLNYARQLIDLWSYDVRARAGQFRAPLLLLSAELDQVASPAASREVARLFPNARCVEVRGATHYCLYDRPALVADLMERFFADPRRVEGLAGEVESVA